MEMEVSRGLDGAIDFRVRTISEEERQSQPLLDPLRPHSDELLLVCGWCKKVDLGGRWVEVEEAVSHLGLFEQSLLPDLTHGVCEDCYSRVFGILRGHERRTESNDVRKRK
jgi:hypothetical protein